MIKLETVIFERGIKLEIVGERIFHHCTSLKNVYYCGSTDMSNIKTPFMNITEAPKIYTLETYQSTLTFGNEKIIQTYTCMPPRRRCTHCIKKTNLVTTNILLILIIIIY